MIAALKLTVWKWQNLITWTVLMVAGSGALIFINHAMEPSGTREGLNAYLGVVTFLVALYGALASSSQNEGNNPRNFLLVETDSDTSWFPKIGYTTEFAPDLIPSLEQARHGRLQTRYNRKHRQYASWILPSVEGFKVVLAEFHPTRGMFGWKAYQPCILKQHTRTFSLEQADEATRYRDLLSGVAEVLEFDDANLHHPARVAQVAARREAWKRERQEHKRHEQTVHALNTTS